MGVDPGKKEKGPMGVAYSHPLLLSLPSFLPLLLLCHGAVMLCSPTVICLPRAQRQ